MKRQGNYAQHGPIFVVYHASLFYHIFVGMCPSICGTVYVPLLLWCTSRNSCGTSAPHSWVAPSYVERWRSKHLRHPFCAASWSWGTTKWIRCHLRDSNPSEVVVIEAIVLCIHYPRLNFLQGFASWCKVNSKMLKYG
jgi:hypothetical protein